MKAPPRKARTLRLDKPCKVCGKPVHYTYSGPVEGVCGRCTDRKSRRRRPSRGYHRAMVVERGSQHRRSTAATVAIILVVMVVGAVAVASALGLILG